MVAYGFNMYLLHKPLYVHDESSDSLSRTQSQDVSKLNEEREKYALYKAGMKVSLDQQDFKNKFSQVVDLGALKVDFVSNPKNLILNQSIPSTPHSKTIL